MRRRITGSEHLEVTGSTELRVIEYEPRHAVAFRDLNLSWIEEYFEVEEADHHLLLHPEEAIILPGGAILVAEDPTGVLGVCALLYLSPERYEISKMALRADVRGRGIGQHLLLKTIVHARGLGTEQLFLISNTALEAAMGLYRKVGFVEVPLPADNKYARGNIAMEMDLS